MRITKNLVVNYMSRRNDALWLWLDVKIGRFWYVFMWTGWWRAMSQNLLYGISTRIIWVHLDP